MPRWPVSPHAAWLATAAAVAAFLLPGISANSAFAAESAGCAALNAGGTFAPPNGYSGGPVGTTTPTGAAFNAGETIRISVVSTTVDNDVTVTLRNAAQTQVLLTLLLSVGASTSATVPAGFVGLHYTGVSAGAFPTVANLVITCSEAPAGAADADDVSGDPGQGAELATAQTSVAAVSSISNFVSSAAARRFSGAAIGGPDTAGAFDASARTQYASLLPAGTLIGGIGQAVSDGSFGQLAVAATELADNVLAASDRPLGLWVRGAATFVNSSKPGGAFDGTVLSLGGGGDYMLNDRLILGLALAYERGDIDTGFNAGELNSNGFTAAPYAGWQPLPELVIDASIGISLLDYDTSRSNGTINGNFGATRLFGTLNATGDFRYDRLRLSPLAGVLYLRERQEGYSDSAGTVVAAQTISLGRFSGGLEAGYSFALSDETELEPYLRAEGEWDFVRPGAVTLTTGQQFRPGSLGGVAAFGLNLSTGGGFSANIEASYDGIGRDSYDSTTIQGTLRFAF